MKVLPIGSNIFEPRQLRWDSKRTFPSFSLINKGSTDYQCEDLQIATVCSISGKFVTFCYPLEEILANPPPLIEWAASSRPY